MWYGYINEFGCLTSRNFSDEEILHLDSKWKPIVEVNQSKLTSNRAGYIVTIEPYDAGDVIEYHYIEKFDRRNIEYEIDNLKSSLTQSDYKIIKCYEANLAGTPLPYDIQTLTSERQMIRNRINEYEELLKNA